MRHHYTEKAYEKASDIADRETKETYLGYFEQWLEIFRMVLTEKTEEETTMLKKVYLTCVVCDEKTTFRCTRCGDPIHETCANPFGLCLDCVEKENIAEGIKKRKEKQTNEN